MWPSLRVARGWGRVCEWPGDSAESESAGGVAGGVRPSLRVAGGCGCGCGRV